jgi:hypothetical protein
MHLVRVLTTTVPETYEVRRFRDVDEHKPGELNGHQEGFRDCSARASSGLALPGIDAVATTSLACGVHHRSFAKQISSTLTQMGTIRLKQTHDNRSPRSAT